VRALREGIVELDALTASDSMGARPSRTGGCSAAAEVAGGEDGDGDLLRVRGVDAVDANGDRDHARGFIDADLELFLGPRRLALWRRETRGT